MNQTALSTQTIVEKNPTVLMPLGQVVLGDFRRKKEKRFGPSDVHNSDELLVKLFMKGNTQAFDMLVIKHQKAIARVVAIYIHDHDTVKDVVQDTFIKAYKGLSSFRRDSQFYTWLYRIAVNTALSNFKANRHHRNMLDFDEVFHHESHADLTSHDTPEKSVLNDELRHAINQAVKHLPLALRSSLLLREQEGLSYEQIAEIVGCRIGTVRSRISRARDYVVKATEYLYQA
jgi:RNA polymerase sigma-70 factor (ECF subfamily)